MTDILKMLIDRIMDRNVHAGGAKQLHQRGRVVMGAGGRAKARHRDGVDVAGWVAVHLKRLCGDDQRQRGIQASADADDQMIAMDLFQPLCQAGRLNASDLMTALDAVRIVLRNERERGDRTCQLQRFPLFWMTADAHFRVGRQKRRLHRGVETQTILCTAFQIDLSI